MSQLTRRQFIGTATGLSIVSPALEPPPEGLIIHPRSEWLPTAAWRARRMRDR